MRNYYLILDCGQRMCVLASSAVEAAAMYTGEARIWAVIDTWMFDGEAAIRSELERIVGRGW